MATQEQLSKLPTTVSKSYADVTLTEHDSKRIDQSLSEVDRRFIEDELTNQQLSLSFNHTGQPILESAQHVGIISLPEGLSIRIKPKAAGRNLLSLLQYAHDIEAEVIDQEVSLRSGTTFIDILAALYLSELKQIVRRGLQREYQRTNDTEEYLQGRLEVQQQLQRQGPVATKFECSYDELTYETIANQAILYATSLLTQLVTDEEIGQSLKRNRTRIRRRVTLRPISAEAVRRIELTRLNEHYRDILRLTELVLTNTHIDRLERGNRGAFSLLVDMNRIFERVVERAVRSTIASRAGWSIDPQATRRGLVSGGPPTVKMRPDILVRDQHDVVRFVADAKWKTPGSASNSDIYQMVAYQLTDDVPGLLIYPGQDGLLETDYRVRDVGRLAVIELPTQKSVGSVKELESRMQSKLEDCLQEIL